MNWLEKEQQLLWEGLSEILENRSTPKKTPKLEALSITIYITQYIFLKINLY